MIQIGEYQTLTIKREMPQGFYLVDEEDHEVLMPGKYITPDMKIGDQVDVFVYCDSEDLDVATTEKPLLTVGQFGYLKVTDVNRTGAFCDWGVTKDLFIPFRNQANRLREGEGYVVYLYFDEKSERLVGTTKLKPFLELEADEHIVKGQEVDLLVHVDLEEAYSVIINRKYAGLVYKNEAHQTLSPGQKLKGYIKHIREDKKIDVSLYPIGYKSIEPNADKILEKLEQNDGFLPFSDNSDPELIRKEFGISKKLFKKSLGTLYKQRVVELKEDGIYLKKDQ